MCVLNLVVLCILVSENILLESVGAICIRPATRVKYLRLRSFLPEEISFFFLKWRTSTSGWYLRTVTAKDLPRNCVRRLDNLPLKERRTERLCRNK